MIGRILYARAKRLRRDMFDDYLVRARDKHAWRGIVVGTTALPWWLRPARGPLSRNDVRILVGHPPQTLLLLDEVESEAQEPIRNVWPSLRGLIHLGVDFAPYAETFRGRLGSGVTFLRGADEPEETFALNAFGEQFRREQIGAALAAAQQQCGGEVRSWELEAEYPTVNRSRGRHVFKIDCVLPPPDLAAFARALDRAMPHPARDLLRPPIVRLVRSG